MPPAQALVTTQPFSDDCHPTLNLSYPILSFSFIFVSGLFLAFRSIIRRRRPIHDNAHLCTAFGLPAFPSNEERRVRKQALFAPTVSTLAAQSAIVASSPLHLNVIPGIEPPSTVGRSMNFLCRGLERSSSWGRATIDLFSLAVSTRVFSLFSSPRQKPIGSNEKEDAGHPQHLSDLTDSMVDTDDPEPDMRVPDTINIPRILHSVHSTSDSQFKTEIPVLPFIILSVPSNDDLVEDPPPPVSLDEDLLSPDGTFRSTGFPVLATVDTHDLDDAIRPVLASHLRERRKRPISWPSSNVLATPGMAHWPRWF
ncbi:hypothetical protein F5888DRAFT_1738740 [Russula emetica]|nr:hypothetical protein F5888DRAFT_1738740 [Russula emetica]